MPGRRAASIDLPDARRADHQQVMAAGGGDLERALGLLLALHLGEVLGQDSGVGDGPGLRRCEDRAAGEVVDEGEQRFRRDHLDGPDPGGLGAAARRADEAAVGLGGGERRRKRADDRDQRPVERELAERDLRRHLVAGQDVHRGEDRERDRQVEVRALLRQVGRREVDGDPLRGKREAHRGHRGAHPLLGLGDRLVGQADEVEGGQAGGDRALHLDEPRLDALECHRVGARDHRHPDPNRPRAWRRRR